MSKAKLYASSGDFKSEVELPADFFGIEPNEIAIYLAVKAILNNRRQGSAHSKNKSAVSGGGRKPWKQKGTVRLAQVKTHLLFGFAVTKRTVQKSTNILKR